MRRSDRNRPHSREMENRREGIRVKDGLKNRKWVYVVIIFVIFVCFSRRKVIVVSLV